MKHIVASLGVMRHPDIVHFRLEPLVDLNASRIIAYEVLSELQNNLNPESWFSQLSGREQITILCQQLRCVSIKVKETCFYNLSVEGFLTLNHRDIAEIAMFPRVCLEVSDATVLKYLNEKELYVFFKNISRLRFLGVKIWIDDFSVNDLITLPSYQGNVDGIKIDKNEIHSRHLMGIVNLVRKILRNVPVLIEGVESERDLNTSIISGADIAQGYYWKNHNIITV